LKFGLKNIQKIDFLKFTETKSKQNLSHFVDSVHVVW